MAENKTTNDYAIYWKVWGVLLVLTVTMVFLDRLAMPRIALVVLLAAAMLTKAILISGWFMHLRHEHAALGLGLLVGLLVNGCILYVLILPDAVQIFHQLNP